MRNAMRFQVSGRYKRMGSGSMLAGSNNKSVWVERFTQRTEAIFMSRMSHYNYFAQEDMLVLMFHWMYYSVELILGPARNIFKRNALRISTGPHTKDLFSISNIQRNRSQKLRFGTGSSRVFKTEPTSKRRRGGSCQWSRLIA